MSQPKKLGRPALLVDPEEIRVTLTTDRIAYVREHWPSLSEGLRALIDAHIKSTGDKPWSISRDGLRAIIEANRTTGKPQGRS